MFSFDLRSRLFIGILVEDKNAKKKTLLPKPDMPNMCRCFGTYCFCPEPMNGETEERYKVHIPELMPFIPKDEGIWCKNTLMYDKLVLHPTLRKYVRTYDKFLSLVINMKHYISFVENDINSGIILAPVSPLKQENK